VNNYFGSPIDTKSGTRWVRSSLASGSILSAMVMKRLSDFSAARLLAPDTALPGLTHILDDNGRGIRTCDVDLIAGRVLEKFSVAGVQTLVVEDDLARRGDALSGHDVAYVDDHVVRWIDLTASPVAAVQLLRRGASGYPLNAFACWLSPEALGLESGRDLGEGERASIVSSTGSVLVSVYDAEAFVALMSPELGLHLE